MVCRNCEPRQVEKREISAATRRAASGGEDPPTFVGVFDVFNYHIAHLMGREPVLAVKLVSPARRRIIQ